MWAVRESFSYKVTLTYVYLKHKRGGARWHLGGNVPSQNKTGVEIGASWDSEEQVGQQGTSQGTVRWRASGKGRWDNQTAETGLGEDHWKGQSKREMISFLS